MLTPPRVQRRAEHRRMAWANGGGTTAEILVHPPDATSWDWRLSLADVASDGPFSSLPGIDRLILVAEGDGMDLTVDGTTHRLTTADAAFAFDGAATTTCRLVDGAITDLNLMVRRGRGTGTAQRVDLGTGEALHVDDDAVAVVVLRGGLEWQQHTIGRFDVLVAPATCPPHPVVATAPTQLVVASVRSAPDRSAARSR